MKFFDKEISPLIKRNAKIFRFRGGSLARFSIEFAKRGYEVIGMDISKTILKYAEKNLNNVKIKLLKEDITSLENINEKFDFSFCSATFYHIPPHSMGSP
ncbi:MAG: class I SAM-dependent methyltransferase [Candidatus Pacearchaeota archaeon]